MKNSVVQHVENNPSTSDRISELPDVLLAQIVSSLPTKEAVATSVLSKRWTHIFTLLTSLDFDDSPISYCVKHPHIIERCSDFKMFVDNVLRKYDSGNNLITSFSLKYGMNNHTKNENYRHYCGHSHNKCYPSFLPSYRVRKWMCFPLSRGVKELDVCTRLRRPGTFPFDLFRCRTLQVLKLDVNFDFELPESLDLPNLKVLHLTLECFPDGDFITRLLSNCPLLEDLALTGDWKGNHPVHIVSAPSLRRLFISTLEVYYQGWDRSEFVLDAPSLEYLVYNDTMAAHYSICELNSLVEAAIYGQFKCFTSSPEVILDLIRPLFNVRRLTLCDSFTKTLERCRLQHNKLPMFHNLNHLELSFRQSKLCHEVVLELLNASPFLQTLVFLEMNLNGPLRKQERKNILLEIKNLSTIVTTPSCLEYNLKRIKIKEWEGEELELALIEYFLRHASVLEEMVVVCTHSTSMEDMLLLDCKLQKFPRRSVTCSVRVEACT